MSSPEWDQSRAQSKPLPDPNLVLCLIQMACPMPFFPNSTNYVGTGEHDKNPRKYWYLVLNQGVFTKKCVTLGMPPFLLLKQASRTDADTAAAGSAKVYIFFTHNDTRNKWAKNCIRRHAHDGDTVLDAECDDASASSEDDSAPSVRSISPTPGRQTPARAPARHTPARQTPAGAANTPSPKARVVARFRAARPGPESHPCQEGVCAAALQGRHPALRNGSRPCPYRRAHPHCHTRENVRDAPRGFV
jgi:hypothetical protein